jgi:hypothetical protein
MSYLKDVLELHISLRSFIIAIAIAMPFWYFDLYLFHYDFFKITPIQLPVVASFCLTFVWISANFMCSIIWVSIIEKSDPSKKPDVENRFLLSVFASVFYTATLTFIGYIFNMDFKCFLKTATIIIAIRFIFGLLFEKATRKVLAMQGKNKQPF